MITKSTIYKQHLKEAAVRRRSTKLLVFSNVLLKISQISLRNTCAGYNVNVKVWLYAFSLHLYYKRDACKQFFSSEFRRIFKKTFLFSFFYGKSKTMQERRVAPKLGNPRFALK